jgi:peroxiredoxin
MHDPEKLPDDLPAPQDDGAARHLTGLPLPEVTLPATDGRMVALGDLDGRTIVYAYPRTGVPGRPSPDGWDAIPGARGCTPQACAFRDHHDELRHLGVSELFGLSTQDTGYQQEAVGRLHLPFALLSDAELRLAGALELPTFDVDGRGRRETLLKRLTLVIDDGFITKVFYPVFPPDQNAADVMTWLEDNETSNRK